MKHTLVISCFVAAALLPGCAAAASGTNTTPTVDAEAQVDDVSIENCRASEGTVTCDVTIINAGDQTLTYFLEAAVETDGGDTIGHATTVVPDIGPGEIAHDGMIGTFDGVHDHLRIRLVTVERTPS